LTVQRLADRGEMLLVPTGIAIVLCIFRLQDALRDSDAERQDFASYPCWSSLHIRQGCGPTRQKGELIKYKPSICLIPHRRMEGLYPQPFLSRLFAFTLSAIEHSQKVLRRSQWRQLTPTACGALGLSVSAVSVVYILYQATLIFTTRWNDTKACSTAHWQLIWSMLQKGKTVNSLNYESRTPKIMRQTGFQWRCLGKGSRNYAKSAHRWWAHYALYAYFDVFDDYIFARPSAALYDSDNIVDVFRATGNLRDVHSEPFPTFPMIYDVFMEFPMFAPLISTYSTSMDYLCIPHTIVHLSDCVQTFSALFRFYYLWRYWYSDVSLFIVFGWLYHYYSFDFWSLVVSNPSMHFDLVRGYFTYIYIPSHLHKITSYCVPPTFVRLVSLRFDFDFVPFVLRPYPSQSTSISSFYCALRSFVVLARILSFRSDLARCFVYYTSDSYTNPDIRLHSLSDHFSIGYWPHLTLYILWPYRNS